jgi:hypothetical protein
MIDARSLVETDRTAQDRCIGVADRVADNGQASCRASIAPKAHQPSSRTRRTGSRRLDGTSLALA